MANGQRVSLGFPRRRGLRLAVDWVVANDNCSGCGACAALSPAIEMVLDEAGFLRPVWRAGEPDAPALESTFRQICPGVAVQAPTSAAPNRDPILGRYVSLWSGYASDDALRYAGSSGGALSALIQWSLETGVATQVTAAARALGLSTRTAPTTISTHLDVLNSAGSRYAPYAAAETYRVDSPDAVFVGKPCEAYAVRQQSSTAVLPGLRPLVLSFFCAGVPSQHATDDLVNAMGLDPSQVTGLRYRGNGWPGTFSVTDANDHHEEMSYEESWGAHLGKRLQGRCRICPDGTGEHADIAVGDYWEVDGKGFPRFEDAPGVSVVVARTPRGHEILLRARQAGVIALTPITAENVVRVQPFQERRRQTLWGRLVGKRLTGKAIPRFRGHHSVWLAAKHPQLTYEYIKGSYRRFSSRNAGDDHGH